jgi:hypothetical protein
VVSTSLFSTPCSAQEWFNFLEPYACKSRPPVNITMLDVELEEDVKNIEVLSSGAEI